MVIVRLTSVAGHHLGHVFLVPEAPLPLLVDGAGEKVFLGLGEWRLLGLGRRVAEHWSRRGGELRVREELVSVAAERLPDLVLELRHVATVAAAHTHI